MPKSNPPSDRPGAGRKDSATPRAATGGASNASRTKAPKSGQSAATPKASKKSGSKTSSPGSNASQPRGSRTTAPRTGTSKSTTPRATSKQGSTRTSTTGKGTGNKKATARPTASSARSATPKGGTRTSQRRATPVTASPKSTRPNFAIRRTVAAVIAAVLLIATGFGVFALVGFIQDQIEARSTELEPTATATGPSEDELANPVQCKAEALDLAVTFPNSVNSGEGGVITVTVRNDGEVPCLTNTGSEHLQLTVSSGDDSVWSRTHCGLGSSDREILLSIGSEDVSTYRWQGLRSATGCSGNQADAEPGTYRVVATLAADQGSAEAEAIFTIN